MNQARQQGIYPESEISEVLLKFHDITIMLTPTISYVNKAGVTIPQYSLVTWVNDRKVYGRRSTYKVKGFQCTYTIYTITINVDGFVFINLNIGIRISIFNDIK